MNRYVKYFDSNNKCFNLLVHDKELLKNAMQYGVRLVIYQKKWFDNEPVYDNKYIKTKIKIYNDRINTNVYGNKMPEDNECCTCLSVMLLDYIVKIDNDYCPQIFLDECKYAINKRKIMNKIHEFDESDKSDELRLYFNDILIL